MPAHIAMILCALAWIVFWRASIREVHLLLLPLMFWLAVFAAFGWQVARLLVFPIGFLYFAVPAWDVFTPILQSLTVKVNSGLLTLFHVPAYVDGDLVFLPSGTFAIERGCSGLHFMIVGLALAALLGELDDESIRNRALLLGLMLLLAVVTNWIRVFTIIEAGYLTQMRHYLVTVDHYRFGWMLFAGAVALFLWLSRKLFPAATVGKETDIEKAAAPRALVPLACVTAVLPLLLLPAAIFAAQAREGRSMELRVALPKGLAGWKGPEVTAPTDWQPVFQGAAAGTIGTYTRADGRAVEAFLVVYREQHQGSELISSDNSLLGSAGLEGQGETVVNSAIGKFREVHVSNPEGGRSLVWFAYDVGGRPFVTPLLAQVWYGASTVMSEKLSGLIAFRAMCASNSCDEARSAIEQFAGEMGKELRTAVRLEIPSERVGTPGSKEHS